MNNKNTKRKQSNIRVYNESRRRLKIAAIKQGISLMELIDRLSKKV